MINPIQVLNEFRIHFQISADMITKIIERREIKKNVENLTVRFTEDTLVLAGKLSKTVFILPLKVPFKIIIRPAYASGRRVYCTVDKVSPLNAEWLKKILFKYPPWVKYADHYLEINLENLDTFNRVPFGRILSIHIEDQCFVAKIGI